MDELEFRRFLLSEPQPEDARDIDRLNQAISQDASKEKFAQNIYQHLILVHYKRGAKKSV